MQAGADVNLADDSRQSAYLISTSEVGAHEAVVFGEGNPADQAAVAALVAGGVALDIPDGGGETALAHAERRGQREVASILRSAGATG